MSTVPTPEETAAVIGPWAGAAEAYQLLTVDVPAEHWVEALTAARDGLGLAFFDWLSAVDELGEGFSVCAHLAGAGDGTGVRHLLLRTRVPREGAALPTAAGVYAGASWHERETHEMFGIGFEGHRHLEPLLLPEGFEGHPLRKEFVLAARVAKAWPGAKEPGESDHGDGPVRRKMQPAGVPDPNEWGPLKGTLPPVAERPARATRGARPGAGAGAAAGGAAAGREGAPAVRADRPRRTRSITEGSASQTAAGTGGAAGADAASVDAPSAVRRGARSSDAPWHSPVPASGPEPEAAPKPEAEPQPDAAPQPEAEAKPEPEPEAAPQPEIAPQPEAGPGQRGEGSPRKSAEPTSDTGTETTPQNGDGA